jgi:hypothetical protein
MESEQPLDPAAQVVVVGAGPIQKSDSLFSRKLARFREQFNVAIVVAGHRLKSDADSFETQTRPHLARSGLRDLSADGRFAVRIARRRQLFS